MVPQFRNPVVDGGEEGGGVGDAIAEEEDVGLPVGERARGARSPQATRVPHRVLDPSPSHHTLLLVAREGGRRVRLQVECQSKNLRNRVVLLFDNVNHLAESADI